MQRRARDVRYSCFILPEHHIDHGFPFSSLSSLFIRPPRALSLLATVHFPRFPHAGRLPGVQLCWISSASRLNLQRGKKKTKTVSRLWKVTTFTQDFKKEDRAIIRVWTSTPTWSDLILITFAPTVTEAGEVCGGQRGFKVTSSHSLLIFDISCLGLSPFKQFNPQLSLSKLHPSNHDL